jgi:transcriptional regulator with XRE-family HTH domain
MIGDKLKSIRTAQGKTLRQVEKDTTISNAYLSQLENGKIKHPSYNVIKILSDYYGIKTDMCDMSELNMLISTMTDIELANLTLFAKFILNTRCK